MKIITLLTTLCFMSNQLFSQKPKVAESIKVLDKEIYYEVYGEGPPLFLLHGYSLSSVSWKPFVKDYMSEFEVYLIDLTGHGKSSQFKDPLSIKSVAKDLHAFTTTLGLEKIQAIGFSFGGDVLLHMSLLNPELIGSMIVIGALGTFDVNDHPNYLNDFVFEKVDQFPWMRESHSSESKIKAILNQFKNYTIRLTDEEMQNIVPEVFIIFGDDDEGIPNRRSGSS